MSTAAVQVGQEVQNFKGGIFAAMFSPWPNPQLSCTSRISFSFSDFFFFHSFFSHLIYVISFCALPEGSLFVSLKV